MKVLYYICIGLSIGIAVGCGAGGIKAVFHRTPYPQKRVEAVRKLVNRIAQILKYITCMVLVLGLVWCAYFLVLAISTPGQSEYANNMAELIVAVLTVISIIFAFVEFLRRKGGEP